MNELQIFSYSDKQVRTLLRNGEPFKRGYVVNYTYQKSLIKA